MKKIFLVVAVLSMMISDFSYAASSFDDNFTDATMRIDYVRTGDANGEVIAIDRIYKYGVFAGNKENLIDSLGNGRNFVYVKDASTGELIFSKGFDNLFSEYQATDDALKGVKRSMHESVLMPFPKKKVNVVFMKRNKRNELVKLFETTVDPADEMIISENFADPSIKVVKEHISGDPHKAVDIAFIGEGYTKQEFSKFKKDLAYFTKLFFTQEPFKSTKDKFNIYGVFKPSLESGTDEPTAGIFKKTAINSSFNTLGTERYLMAEDNKTMRDVAASVPYDHMILMVNSKRYGGGAIYNQYATLTTGSQWKDYVLIHEFGHHFGGLADEYYTSEVALNDFYPKGTDPVEPNITSLLDKKNLKWKEFVTAGVEIPTPWEKADYDKSDLTWQAERRKMMKNIDAMKKAKAPKTEIDKAQKEYDAKDLAHNRDLKKYFDKSKFKGIVGAFEGAGYASKGLYRPELDCIMFSKGLWPFCKVCDEAMRRVIAFYSK